MVATTMTWLSDLGKSVGIVTGHNHHHFKNKRTNKHHHLPTLGILSFEAARTMSRLVSLYKSLSDDEIQKLRVHIMRSEGVSYLNSKDESFLFKLACIELMEDLDRIAVSVSRLGKKCSDPKLTEFDNGYADLKLGFIDLNKLEFGLKEIEKIIDKMTKFISATSNLYAGLETLAELESLERKTNRWKDTSGPKATNVEFSEEKLAWQKQHVQHLKEISLWNQPFDKIVGFMARTVCVVYARVWQISVAEKSRHLRCASLQVQLQFNPEDGVAVPSEEMAKEVFSSKSMPIFSKISKKNGLLRFLSGETKQSEFRFGVDDFGFGWVDKTARLIQQAPESTVGGSGLALRYANVIIMVEKYLASPNSISEYARENLFEMLPVSLKKSVRFKLRKLFRNDEVHKEDESLAEGWRDGLNVMLGWLAPMAHDTVRWMNERNFEKQNFDAKPMVLLLQTLFFADREKTEAAIVEVLVGLSCICRYEIHRRRC